MLTPIKFVGKSQQDFQFVCASLQQTYISFLWYHHKYSKFYTFMLNVMCFSLNISNRDVYLIGFYAFLILKFHICNLLWYLIFSAKLRILNLCICIRHNNLKCYLFTYEIFYVEYSHKILFYYLHFNDFIIFFT